MSEQKKEINCDENTKGYSKDFSSDTSSDYIPFNEGTTFNGLPYDCNFAPKKLFSFRNKWAGNDSEESRPKTKMNKHPPHLRGKEIGLWYKNQSLKRRSPRTKDNSYEAPIISIKPEKLKEINTFLANSELQLFMSHNGDSFHHYNNIAESDFKHRFMNNITGSIEQKLNNNSNCNMKSCPDLDNKYFLEFQIKQLDPKYISMQKFREKLPSFKVKNVILNAIKQNQIILISGETGCGKTTQVPQFILDDALQSGKGSTCKIGCTQPRRISAISVAERVADERNESCGQSVGYQIRLERIMPQPLGSIVFCTTGVLLQKMESDPRLSEFSHIIIDEIHERDTISDFVLTILKQVMVYRTDLKIILMSATLNAEQFSGYYGNCRVVHIPGFTYPVEEFFLEDILQEIQFYDFDAKARVDKWTRNRFRNEIGNHIESYAINNSHKYNSKVLNAIRDPRSEFLNLKLIDVLISYICRNKAEGAILVFLTGLSNITKLHSILKDSGRYPQHKFVIYPLHSKMPTCNQKEVFLKPRAGVRKIIISTNIAETSITIDDIVYVIDCGKIKMKNYDPATNISTLQDEWVSRANAKQRSGRAGRVQSGISYHLFTRPRYHILKDFQTPEILRTRIEEVILDIKILQLGDITSFLQRVLDPPDQRVVEHSIKLLQRLNALDSTQNLTPLGYHLAKLPMDPHTGKMILMGALFSCIQPIFGIAASLSFKDAFMFPLGKEKDVEKLKLELSNGTKSDHIVLAEALKQWEEAEQKGYGRKFCWDHYLNAPTLHLLKDMKNQFAEYLYEMKFLDSTSLSNAKSNINSDNISLIRAVICSGLYPNVAFIKHRKYKRNQTDEKKPCHVIFATPEDGRVDLHPKSVNANAVSFESSYFLYYTKLKSSGIFLHDTTMVHPLPLIFFGDNITRSIEDEIEFINVNGLKFRCQSEIADVIIKLRKCLDNLLSYKASHPGIVNWASESDIEKQILKMISELISAEDDGTFQEYEPQPDTSEKDFICF